MTNTGINSITHNVVGIVSAILTDKFNRMTEDAKKVWEVMENDLGWSNQPEGFHLEYFEDIIRATKQALTIPDVVGQSEQCCEPLPKDSFYLGMTCPKCNKPFRIHECE